jgi:serine/threonine protein phosphatase PrpC
MPTLCQHTQGSTLTTAWVGDSRMVLGRQSKKGWRNTWEAIDLSVDHKPTTPEERQRILDSHGRVERCARGGVGLRQSQALQQLLGQGGCMHMRRAWLRSWAYAWSTHTPGL